MIVEVTQENINQGVVKDCNSCPISLAMQDNGFRNVRVQSMLIFYGEQPPPFGFRINIDFLVTQWIEDFDKGKHMTPIKIEIDEEKYYATLVK